MSIILIVCGNFAISDDTARALSLPRGGRRDRHGHASG
jgi:hypothetical protein